jgi:hypothetical protein
LKMFNQKQPKFCLLSHIFNEIKLALRKKGSNVKVMRRRSKRKELRQN